MSQQREGRDREPPLEGVDHLLRAAEVALIQLDQDLRTLRITASAEALFGLRDVRRRRSLAELALELGAPGLTADVEEALRSGGPVERALEGRGGEPTHAKTAAIVDAEGQVSGVAITFTDPSARRALEAAERRQDALLASLLSSLAHELRNPLAPIRSGIELLFDDDADPDAMALSLGIMARQVAHLTELVDDLVDVSRVRQGTLTLRRRHVDVADAVRSALEATRSQIERAGHRLELHAPDEPLVVDADVTRLAQVFTNLLANAMKYTPSGGRISISMGQEGDDVVVSISDDGAGIDPDMLEGIFDLFGQGGEGPMKGQTGLGVGLSLARSLVSLHGGAISASSPGVGRGSEFTVRLPRVLAPGEVRHESDRPPAPGEIPRLRVLVVDDNPDAMELLALGLARAGHEVETAADGEEAIERAERFLPHVVLMDLGMPRLDGLSAAKAIRAQPWSAGMTLVALTGWGQRADRDETRDAGFDHHLVKPANRAEVHDILRRAGARLGSS
ncbi:MAG: hypothetical protein SangKO_037230 [Sandaracinaceae bacterium]